MTEAERLQGHCPGAWRQVLLRWSGPRAEREDARRRAERVAPLPLSPQVGACWFPVAAAQTDGSLAGALVCVRVGPGPARLPAERSEQVERWVHWLVGRAEHDLRELVLHLDNMPARWEVYGASMGLAAAVATISSLLGRAPRGVLVLSAALADGGGVNHVGHLDQKQQVLDAELWAQPGAERWVAADAADAGDVARRLDAWFGPGWRRELMLAVGAQPSQLAHDAHAAYSRRDHGAAERLADLAIGCTTGDAQATAQWIAGATRLHRGAVDLALPLLQQAHAALSATRGGERRLFLLEELTAYLGIALVDALRPHDAVRVLEEALAALDRAPSDFRQREWRMTALQVAGSLRRARVVAGDLEGALAVQLERALGDASLEEERARCLLDLADTQLKLGHSDAAVRTLEQAEQALATTATAHRPFTRRFLVIQQVRAGVAAPQAPVAPPDVGQWPQPVEALQSVQALGRVHFEAYVQSHLDPAGLSALMCLALSGEAARAVVRWGRLSWAQLLSERLLAAFGDGLDGPGRDALAALGAGEGSGWLRRAGY